jgi:Carboxypeptidase regulatory-like domain/TonB dependent receptor
MGKLGWRWLRAGMLAGILLLCFCTATFAMPPAASWSGVLRDASGNPVAAAEVVLAEVSGKPGYTTDTKANGEFRFAVVAPATYRISVVTEGGTYECAQAVVVAEAGSRTTNLRMMADRSLVVMQQENSAVTQASGGERLSQAEVSSLPLNSRDFSKLLLLAAGTMTDTNGAANFTQQFAINGQRGTTTVFALDGVDTTDPEMGGATFSNFNVDAIQEVQSSSGVMLPEIGHGAAGFTNVVSKSGTNAVHGSVFEFFRNAALDARNYFDHVEAGGRRIPAFNRNEFGGAVGGPVVMPGYTGRDRTYFFGEYQGFRQILGTTQVFPVPTAAERQGIDTTTFPGDTLTVPVSAAIKPVLDGYPLPNDPSGPFGARTFATSSTVSTVTDQLSLRVDHKLSAKSQLFGRFSLNQVTGPVTNPDQTALDPTFAIKFFDHQRNAGVTYARTISPHLSLQASLGYVRSTPNFPAENHTQPGILFGDGLFEAYGGPAGSIFGSYGNLYQLKFDMTGVRGRHTMKWGTEIRVNRDSTIFGTAPNGAYSFGGGRAYSQVAIKSASGTHDIAVGDPLPDSLTGLLTATPYSYNISAPAEFTPVGAKFDAAGVRRQAYNFYFQDAWKATSRLTVSYGLRYEVNSRIGEQTLRTSLPVFEDANGNPTPYWNHQARMKFVVNPQPPYNKDWNGWAPRLALDFAPTEHTVFHAGGAITSRVMNLWQENYLTASVPYLMNPFITAQPGAAVPFQNIFVPQPLPPAYDIAGNLIFPNGKSTDAKPNTVMDLQRYLDDVAGSTPGHQVQLPALSAVARNFRNGYIGSWTLGVDHDFGDFKATAAYVGTAGVHLPYVYYPNSYTGADPAFAPFTKFDAAGNRVGGASSIYIIASESHSSYHALQSSVTKNSARMGLGLQASYTYSKAIDDTSSVQGGQIAGAGVILQTSPQDPWNPRAEKGPSTFDVTHVFTVSWIQLLPFNRVSFLHPLGRAVTSGWQFLNITTLMTGMPFTVYSGVQQTGAGASGADRPDLVATPNLSTSGQVQADYFGRGADNASFFSIPIDVANGTGPNQGRFGTLGRGTFRGPGFKNLDVALIKDTPFGRRGGGELGTMEFRAEFFNVFNLVNFGLPSNVVRGSGFGYISKTAGSSRQIQFSLKLVF